MAPQREYNIEEELGVARSRDIIAEIFDKGKVTMDRRTGCWTCTYASSHKDGYREIKRRTNQQIQEALETGQAMDKNAGKHFYVHRIMFLAHFGYIPEADDEGSTVSHLCDNTACFRGDHLTTESQAVNNSRQECSGPGVLDEYDHLIPLTVSSPTACSHDPACFPPRHITLQCPHSNNPPPWQPPNVKPLTLAEWQASLELPAELPEPVSEATQIGLHSEHDIVEETEEDREDAEVLDIPSSPPLAATPFAQGAPNSSRPGSAGTDSDPVRIPGRRMAPRRPLLFSSRPGSSRNDTDLPTDPLALDNTPASEIPNSDEEMTDPQ